MSLSDPSAELAALRALLAQKDATIANLERYASTSCFSPPTVTFACNPWPGCRKTCHTGLETGRVRCHQKVPVSSRLKSRVTHSLGTFIQKSLTRIVFFPLFLRQMASMETGDIKTPIGSPTRNRLNTLPLPRASSEDPKKSYMSTAARISTAIEDGEWGRYNPFRELAQSSAPTPSTTIPPITPIASIHTAPKLEHHSTIKVSASSPTSRRRSLAVPHTHLLNNASNQLIPMRRCTSISIEQDSEHIAETPPLLAAPSSELDWSDDNPFSFLKAPAPSPPGTPSASSCPSSALSRPAPSPLHYPNSPLRGTAAGVHGAGEMFSEPDSTPTHRRRPRSHSSTLKVRFDVMDPPPPLVPPPMPIEMTSLSPEDSLRLQIIQAYFRGRIERARVKHMIEKQVMGRRFTMEEILLSERRYVHHLDLIVNLFLRPLQKTDILTPAEISAIFMNIEKLYQLARNFLRQLEELFTEDPLVIGHRIGLLFLNMVPEWRQYSYLVNHFEGAQIQLSRCKERKSFRDWLAKAESHPSLEKLGMMDYLIAAAKRIPQYQLLLKAVKKHTPKSSRHYQTIKTAKTMISELAAFLNDKKRSFDNMRRIELIQRSLNGKIPNLMTSGREFLAETVVKEQDMQARMLIDRRIFLFNDSLLIATSSNSKFDRLIYLSGAEMNARTPLKMSLKVDDVSLIVIFQTESEKTRWVSLVGHAIETLHFQEQESALKDFAAPGFSRPKVLNSVVLHQGYLLKHRRSSGGWNKRWFVLEQGVLYYFKNPSKVQDITDRGTIDLGAYSVRYPLDWTSGHKRRFGFELTSRHRPIFILATEDSRSRDEWVNAIKPFLQSTKSSEREGVLYAASTSSDVARTSSTSRVLLPSFKPPTSSSDDLIKWSDDISASSSPSVQSLTSSAKFYFNEDFMPRPPAVSSEDNDCNPDHWFSQATELPSSPTRVNSLRRSMSSSSVSGS